MSLERDFTAWIQNRDPDALNRVFDATAGRLLLLAVHLGGARSSAEDLLQETFLAAMAKASTWDRQRPLWPWLTAILQNQARMELRRRRRRREVEISEAADAVDEEPDPLRIAASDEAFAAVMQAIDALPVAYRQVLRLRLVHGLRNVEIAHSLEIPVGTVRAQVHRGLERLRNALPTGVGVLVGVWLGGEGALLAQVRARVATEALAMQAAAAGLCSGATVGATVFGGWFTMYGKAVGLVVAMATLIAFWVTMMGEPSLPEAGRGDPQPVVLAAAGEGGAAAASTAADRRPHPVVAKGGDTQLWTLTVAVVTPSGAAIRGADVRVWWDARGGEHWGAGVREEVARGRSGVDGKYRCGLDRLRERSGLFRHSTLLWVSASHAGRRQDQILSFPKQLGAREFSVELQLHPAIHVTGRVVDDRGGGVEGASIYWVSSRAAAPKKRVERSGSDGALRVSKRVSDREGVGLAVAHPVHGTAFCPFTASTGLPAKSLSIDLGEIRLDRRNAIRGRVVLADGLGLAGFPVVVRALDVATQAAARRDPAVLKRSLMGRSGEYVLLRGGRLVQEIARPVTAPDGSFACAGLDPNRAYAVYVRDTWMRKHVVMARAGDDPLLIELDRQRIALDVRDTTGEALPGARIAARGFDPESARARRRAAEGLEPQPLVVARFFPRDSQGRRLLLSPSGWRWEIRSFDEAARDDVTHHLVRRGLSRVDKTLVLREETRFGALRLLVVDEAGRPWPRFALRLRNLDRRLERNHSRLVPQPEGRFVVEDLLAGWWRLTTYLGRDLLFPLPAHVRGTTVQDVVIADGRSTEVKVTAAPGGLLALRLESASPPAGGVWQKLEVRRQPGGAPVPLHAYDAEKPIQSGGYLRYGTLIVTKAAFPPGEHEFTIAADGFRTVRCRARIRLDRYVTKVVEMFAE